MEEQNVFVDILKPRNTKFGIFRFMTKSWLPKKTLVLDKYYTPQELKDLVVNSVFMDTYLNAESTRQGISVAQLRKEMVGYLDEMALEKKIHVVRWVGLVFLKVIFMMRIGVYVNEPVVHQLKQSMGNNPVLFLPTHRSYADFCLMTYLCFHYDIELPAVAAGMDFHDMAVVGERMREMCAFYIRRSLVGAPLYAATLKQYVRTLVTHHPAPLEFFIEGTRSRSNKSLPPKYGMLQMALLPYFAREVMDITIVPVNITYDRIIELTLFAYEHLGVPKPRETTEGLVKSLQSLNDYFGNVYVNIGAPISLNEHLKCTPPTDETLKQADLKTIEQNAGVSETLKPADLQALTREQTAAVYDVADRVVAAQQECTIITMPTLLSMVVMQSLMKNRSLHMDEVLPEVEWLATVLRELGARVVEPDLKAGIDRALKVHRRMLAVDVRKHLRLVSSPPIKVTPELLKKMKGHTLSAETMMNAVPVIELQTYVNPALHYLVPPALVYLVTGTHTPTMDECSKDYQLLRLLLRFEFFHVDKDEAKVFNSAVDYCIQKNVVVRNGDCLSAGSNERLQYLLRWAMLPALTSLNLCIEVMNEVRAHTWRGAARAVQARGEAGGGAGVVHPYSLSLEAARGCLRGLLAARALRQNRGKETTIQTVPEVMKKCRDLVQAVLPNITVEYGAGNNVMTSKNVASRL